MDASATKQPAKTDTKPVSIKRPPSSNVDLKPLQHKKPPGAMDWVQIIGGFIAKGRVKRAAVFDRGGKCLTSSKELKIPQDEVISVVRCMDTEFVGLNKPHFGLFFGEDRYLCFRADKKTIIGLTRVEFFVAHIYEDIVIFAFADLEADTNVSCIGEVWTFAREVRSKMELEALIG